MNDLLSAIRGGNKGGADSLRAKKEEDFFLFSRKKEEAFSKPLDVVCMSNHSSFFAVVFWFCRFAEGGGQREGA